MSVTPYKNNRGFDPLRLACAWQNQGSNIALGSLLSLWGGEFVLCRNEPVLKYYDDAREIHDVGPKRRDEFALWRRLLAGIDANAEGDIRAAINAYVNGKIAEHGWTQECWFCSSFIPGPDWRRTPYQPIYDAMYERYGEEPAWNQSRLFFGLLVKDVMIHRQEHWLCYKVPEQEEVEKGTNYFPDFSAEAVAS